ncbi:MAG: serine--tRNA ligase [archaeon]
MLGIEFVRDNFETVKNDLEKRGQTEKIPWLKELIDLDKKRRQLINDVNKIRNQRNILTSEIEKLKIEKKDFKLKISEAKQLPEKIKELDRQLLEAKNRINYCLMRIPNVLHESVPVGVDDSCSQLVREWGGKPKPSFELKHHRDILLDLGGVDFERAVKISGSGFYYLKGEVALLSLSAQRFAIDYLIKKGFTLVQPPAMMHKEFYQGVVDLQDFEDVMYKIDGSDNYLIATAEHPLAAMYSNEILEDSDLPIKLVGFSTNFRKEIGKHGLDERGLFRVHQFDKIEQFVFCKPEDSWKIFEELSANTEEIHKALEIPYRIVNVCTGDMGSIASKKYDIEGYSPREDKYIELGSCSNCTDYQARRLNIKYRAGLEKEFVHTLNNTAFVIPRPMRLLMELNQLEDGSVKIPKVLQPYMNGLKELKPKAKKV